MRLINLILPVALLTGPAIAFGHEGAGPNGGQIAEVQGHHIEFTIKEKEIVLFLTDNDSKPIGSKGTSGRVVILEGAKPLNVELAPVEPNALSAKLDAPLAAGAKVVVSAKLGDGHDLQARFVVK